MPDVLLARGAMRHPGRRSISEHLFELARHEESKMSGPQLASPLLDFCHRSTAAAVGREFGVSCEGTGEEESNQ